MRKKSESVFLIIDNEKKHFHFWSSRSESDFLLIDNENRNESVFSSPIIKEVTVFFFSLSIMREIIDNEKNILEVKVFSSLSLMRKK